MKLENFPQSCYFWQEAEPDRHKGSRMATLGPEATERHRSRNDSRSRSSLLFTQVRGSRKAVL